MQRRQFSLGLMAATAMPLWGCAAASNPASRDQTARAWNDALVTIERSAQGRLGVAMLDTGSGLALGWRQDERFAMASTFKAVLAGWMLALVDQGKEQLDSRVHYAATEVVAYSPVSGPRAGDGGGLTVGELCAATVSLSDNTAANVLLARHGGPAGFTAFVRSLGDGTTRLDRTEPALNEAAVGDPRDTTTPLAMLHTLQKLVLGDALSIPSRAWLQRWLAETSTGDKRLRAGVPGWKVGDKTGTASDSGTANDIGVMWPPGGGAPVLVTCYLTRSAAAPEQRDAAIAQVARAVVAAREGFRAS
ncbi:class A beta-lactamase [Acidovorax sp. HMWF029]|jgi:beta-lactamase class A|uniref:ACA family class A beta-lactamase n=1 Tax=Acidovorax sp. HMWF029 TaxID=2056863 RepID=UPI000D3917A3|nr:class A beta-lactamase [Acidovorax sp. HMWF029]PTT21745.1 class A beta-lactamase [Acidovorax sp. HMWF029]